MIDVIFTPGGKAIVNRCSKADALKIVEDAFVAMLKTMEKAAHDGNYFLLDEATSCAFEGIKRYEELGGFRLNIDCYSDEPSARLAEADSWQVYYMVHDYAFRLKVKWQEWRYENGVQEN